MIEFIHHLLQPILTNPVVTGISMTAVLGGAFYQLRQVPHLLYQTALRLFSVEMTVKNSDPAFVWIEKWLADQPYAKRTKRVRLRSFDDDNDDFGTEDGSARWGLTPGNGSHCFWWRKRLVYINRSSDDNKESGRRGRPIETIHFRTMGRSQAVLRAVVQDAIHLIKRDETVAIRVWRGWWATVRGKTPRGLDTLVLRDGQVERLLADLAWFQTAKPWYDARGIPYRRGYLFYGPPGTGKTSIVLALAGHLRRPVCLLNLNTMQDDDSLMQAVSEAPVDAILVIEDIDCAASAKARGEDKSEENSEDKSADKSEGKSDGPGCISKAGLLNALDGVATPDGRIFIMTTNFPDRLDAALIRPGRADVRELFDDLGAAEQVRMAARFYPAGQFVPLPTAVSPARMQAAFMQHPVDAAAARAALLAPAFES